MITKMEVHPCGTITAQVHLDGVVYHATTAYSGAIHDRRGRLVPLFNHVSDPTHLFGGAPRYGEFRGDIKRRLGQRARKELEAA